MIKPSGYIFNITRLSKNSISLLLIILMPRIMSTVPKSFISKLKDKISFVFEYIH
jgi:hypothetical protein